MKAQSAFKSLVVPAGLSVTVHITGSSFYVEYASGVVDCTFDDGATLRCKSGQTFDCPPGDYFETIIFTNPDTANSVTVTFYAGTLIVGTRTPGVFTKPSPTYLISKTYAGIAMGVDTPIDVTNLRAGKTVADSRNYLIIQIVLAVGADVVALSYTTGGGATLGMQFTGVTAPVRLDTPAALFVRGVAITGAASALVMAFYNYDS